MNRNAATNYQEESAAISLETTKGLIQHVRTKCCAPTIDAKSQNTSLVQCVPILVLCLS
jgi:hypothetical protein